MAWAGLECLGRTKQVTACGAEPSCKAQELMSQWPGGGGSGKGPKRAWWSEAGAWGPMAHEHLGWDPGSTLFADCPLPWAAYGWALASLVQIPTPPLTDHVPERHASLLSLPQPRAWRPGALGGPRDPLMGPANTRPVLDALRPCPDVSTEKQQIRGRRKELAGT